MNKEEILKKYVFELVNAPLNLTAFKDLNLAYEFLVNDSIKPLKKNEIGDNFLDVGTGGGVPGVFISVYFDKNGTLIDSSLKKISYVEKLCVKLGIKNLKFVHGRIEEKKELIEQFDSVFAKAVAELRILLELTVPFSKKGGKIFLYKGINYKEELESAQNAIKELKIKLLDVRNYKILDRERFLLIFEKLEHTDSKYPRKFSKIIKNPL
ncbi:MAG: rRNA (guanine527-N7)-methyltransferase [Thermosipho sp. (in: thermotogales)]|nr:rRNA (guanine527-N7)-methyltransferase [Thermosipho sp. (in: thermotogales)]MDN5324492.1 rRNA (guanine527-N7)-methyltransferase [Thermosipho sp. (in: thermotogales)]